MEHTNTNKEPKKEHESQDIIEHIIEQTKPDNTVQQKKEKKSNKKLLIALAIILLLVVAGGAFWFITKNKQTTPSVSSNQSSSQATKVDNQKTFTPFSINYAYTTDKQISLPNCGSSSNTNVYWRPFAGGDKTTALDTGESNNVSYSDIYQNQIVLITDPSCNSKDPTTVWYSKDSGKSYTKLFRGKPLPPANSTTGWEQITSVKFSNDGKAILIGLLNNAGSINTIKEITPDTKETKDIFTVNTAGVFINGYDTKLDTVYYSKGCYNCDGNTLNNLFAYNINTQNNTELFTETKLVVNQIKPNFQKTKFLVVKGTQLTDGIGGGKPYIIEEFDTNTKTSKKLVTINEDTTVNVGYRAGDDIPYYSKGKNLYTINPSGNSDLIFEASKPLLQILYLDKSNIVASTGEYNNFALTNYTIATKQLVSILNGDEKTRLFGVTLQ